MKLYLILFVMLIHNSLHSFIKPEIPSLIRFPLHFFAYIGDDRKIVDLITRGEANINDTDDIHRTAAHWAAIGNQYNTIDTLQELGANLRATDLLGHTPLDFAQHHKHSITINALHDHCS